MPLDDEQEPTTLATPKISKTSNKPDGVKITWKAVTGAVKYKVYCKESSKSGWNSAKTKTTTKTSYTWTGLKSGTKYTFAVQALGKSSKTDSAKSAGANKKYIGQASISNLTRGGKTIKISWDKVGGAAAYRIFYKTGSGGWKTLKSVTTGISYTWKNAKTGTKYTFAVQVVSKDGKTLYNSKSISRTMPASLAKPKISKASNTTSGLKLTWGKVKNAEAYRIIYKSGLGGWHKLADTTKTSYTWKKAKSGTKYTFAVQVVSKDGKTLYNSKGSSLSKKYIAQVKNVKTKRVSKGVTISWDKVTGAAAYCIFYKADSGKWQTLKKAVTGTSYTWTKAKAGVKYTFAVQVVSKDGKTTYNSKSDSVSCVAKLLAAPKLKEMTNTATNGVKLTWKAVTGVKKYRVMYKNKSTNYEWKKLKDVSGTEYVWGEGKAGSGTKYTFTVCCLTADGKSEASSYNKTGKSITFLKVPAYFKAQNVADGIKFSWNESPKAKEYRVAIKVSDAKRTVIATVKDGTSYLWKEAEKGKTYTFTVCAVASDGKSTSAENEVKIKREEGYDVRIAEIISAIRNGTSDISHEGDGSSRYWNWYNGTNSSDGWCAVYASYLIANAGVKGLKISWPNDFRTILEENGCYINISENPDYIPKTGDLVFLNYSKNVDGVVDHVAMIANDGEKNVLHGNWSHKVIFTKIDDSAGKDDNGNSRGTIKSNIIGYGDISKFASLAG